MIIWERSCRPSAGCRNCPCLTAQGQKELVLYRCEAGYYVFAIIQIFAWEASAHCSTGRRALMPLGSGAL